MRAACVAVGTLGSLAPCTTAHASERPLRFSHVRVEDGLSNGWVRAILKDSRGFLWFGTADGLNRFDGRHIRVFEHDPEDPGSLPGSHVTSMLEDTQGRLWFGLSGPATGLALYDRTTERFEHLPLDTRPAPVHAADVRGLLEDSAGRIWVAASGGLYRLNVEERSFTRAWGGPPESSQLVDHEVYRAVEDARGQLWLACGSGLVRLDPATGHHEHWSTVLDGVAIPSPQGVTDAYTDARGFVWFVSDGVGLVRLDPNSGQVRRFASGFGDGALPAERPRRLTGDRRGIIYVGSEDAGLAVLDVRRERFTRYTADPDDPESLSAPSIWALHHDAEGILWVGTFRGGVNAASPLRSRFGLVSARSGQLANPSVASVLEDRGGNVWVGTDGGGLQRRDAATGRFTNHRHDPKSREVLAADSVLALLQDGGGRIWIGMWAGGLQALDPRTGSFTSFRHVPGDRGSLASDHVVALIEDSRGKLLVGTLDGAQVLDRATGRFTPLSTLYDGAGRGAVNTIVEDALGNLWIGNDDAEYVDRESRVVARQHLGAGRVFAIHEDRAGNVWFGTQRGGLACLEAMTGRRRWFTLADGLPSNRVTGILEAGDGSLWLGTGRGIVRFDEAIHLPEIPRFTSFDTRDGVQGGDFRQGASFLAPSGTMYFGGPHGLTVFDPKDFGGSRAAPGAILSSLRILNRPVAFGEAGVGLDAALSEARTLVLSPDETMVTFAFSALEFGTPGKSLYRHRLEGFDAGWSPPSRDRSATYTNLAPGEYRFRVAVGSDGGSWNEDALSLHVVRNPSLLERAWFQVLLLALALATGVWAHRLRLARHRRTETELQARFEEAVAEVETLGGLLPVCAWCRRVRDDAGYWSRIETFVKRRSRADFTESTCPNCAGGGAGDPDRGEQSKVPRGRVPRREAVGLLMLMLLAPVPGMAHDRSLRFDHLDVEDGLPSGWVRGIVKDRLGFMWFATAEGLARYDGRRVVVYHPGPVAEDVPTHQAMDVFEDARGDLWVALAGTPGGIGRYDQASDAFEFLPVGGPEGRGLVVLALAESAGRLWMGTQSGLLSLDPDTLSVTLWRHDSRDPDGLSDDRVRSLQSDPRGGLWIGTARGLNHVAPGDTRPRRWQGGGLLASADIPDLYQDAGGTLWIATMGEGLFRLDPETRELKRYAAHGSAAAALSSSLLQRVTGDGDHVYIGTEDAGLDVLDVGTEHVTHYGENPVDPRGLASRSIWSLYLDESEILWVGTFNGGVDRAPVGGRRFGVLRAGTGGLGAPQVSALLEDHRGDLWVGTDGGGLDRLDRRTGRFTHYRHDPDDADGLSSNAVLSLHEDATGRIWIGTWEGGLQVLDPDTGRFATFRPDLDAPDALHFEHVRGILEDARGNLLLGTQEAGVVEMDRSSGSFAPLSRRYAELEGVLIYAMAQDHAGDLWLGHSFVEHVDRDSGVVTPYRLAAPWVLDVHVDARDNVWFGTEAGGLYVLDRTTGGLRRYGREDGLPSNTVLSVLDDAEGNLWLGTSRGLVRFARGTGIPAHAQMQVFDVRDGLPGYEFRMGAKLRTRSGEIFLGGERGLTHFKPEEIRVDRSIPPVVLTGLELMNEPVRPGKPGSPLQRALAETQELELTAEHSVVTFEFAALEFLAPAKVLYRYRLAGFDPDWSPPVAVGSATYTNLPAGDYRFEVMAANGDGVWGETDASVSVRRLPRLFETRWFYPALLLLALAVAGAAHWRRVARHRRLEMQLAERIRTARAEIQTLSGLLPICGGCRQVRDDTGYWSQIEAYVSARTPVSFSHGICPECLARHRRGLRTADSPSS